MKFRVLQPCRGTRDITLEITDAKRELALRGTKIKRPLFELRYRAKLSVFKRRTILNSEFHRRSSG